MPMKRKKKRVNRFQKLVKFDSIESKKILFFILVAVLLISLTTFFTIRDRNAAFTNITNYGDNLEDSSQQ